MDGRDIGGQDPSCLQGGIRIVALGDDFRTSIECCPAFRRVRRFHQVPPHSIEIVDAADIAPEQVEASRPRLVDKEFGLKIDVGDRRYRCERLVDVEKRSADIPLPEPPRRRNPQADRGNRSRIRLVGDTVDPWRAPCRRLVEPDEAARDKKMEIGGHRPGGENGQRDQSPRFDIIELGPLGENHLPSGQFENVGRIGDSRPAKEKEARKKQDQELLKHHRLAAKDAVLDRIARLRAEIADERQDLRQIRDHLQREEESSVEALRNRIRRLDATLADDRQDLSKDRALLPTLGGTAKKAIEAKIARLENRISGLKQDLGGLRTRLEKDRLSFKDRMEDRIGRLKEEIADERQDLKESLDRLKEKRTEARDRILDRIIRLRESIADQRRDLVQETKELESSLHSTDRPDRESPEAALHHDGDDRTRSFARPEAGPDHHREAISEIREASRIRVARLYSPEHHAGYHARMHRHTR